MAYTFSNITVDSSTLKWGRVLQGFTQFSCTITGSSSNDIFSEIADNTSFNYSSLVSGYTRTGTTVSGTITTLNNNNNVYWRLTDNYTHTPNYVTVPSFHEVRPGSNTYSGRTNASGQSSAEGKFAFLHLTWDVDWVDVGNSINTITCTVTKEGVTTTLTPFKGSIAEGYIDYITDLALDKTATFYTTLKDNALAYSKTYSYEVGTASIAFSLFDDRSVTGAAFGRQSAKEGVWVYNDFYIKGADDKMWKVNIDASGNITTEDATYYDFIWNKSIYGALYPDKIKNVSISDTRLDEDIDVNWEMVNPNKYRVMQLYYVNTNGEASIPSAGTGSEWVRTPLNATSQSVKLGSSIINSFRKNGNTLEMVLGVEATHTRALINVYVNGSIPSGKVGCLSLTPGEGTASFNGNNSWVVDFLVNTISGDVNGQLTVGLDSGYSFQKATYSTNSSTGADYTYYTNPFTVPQARNSGNDSIPYSRPWTYINIYLTH